MSQRHGILIPIGGAEDKGLNSLKYRFDFFERGILRQILDQVPKNATPRIGLISTASSIPQEVEAVYRQAFGALGCTFFDHLFITSRDQTDTPDHLQRIAECNCLIFSGGDQLRLSTILGGTVLLNTIRRRYQEEGLLVAGTSAGAMAMGNTMIYEGSAIKAHLKGEIKFTTGFGFIPNVIIDTHFEKRGRFNRLAQAVAVQPGMLGIGLAEDTGIIIYPDGRFEVIGSGIVTIVNGISISRTNLPDIPVGTPISVEHLVVHILSCGDIYDIALEEHREHTK